MNLKKLSSLLLILLSSVFEYTSYAETKNDVVFIIVDDLNDWIGVMGGHPQSKTPNLDALAGRGILFTNAHCNACLLYTSPSPRD